jgi:hypothetical protein
MRAGFKTHPFRNHGDRDDNHGDRYDNHARLEKITFL